MLPMNECFELIKYICCARCTPRWVFLTHSYAHHHSKSRYPCSRRINNIQTFQRVFTAAGFVDWATTTLFGLRPSYYYYIWQSPSTIYLIHGEFYVKCIQYVLLHECSNRPQTWRATTKSLPAKKCVCLGVG